MDFNLQKLDSLIQGWANRAVGGNPKDIAVGQAQEAISETQRVLGISQDDARKVVASAIYTQGAKSGDSVESIYASLPEELKSLIKYTPQNLEFNQKITMIKTIGTPAVIGVSLLAALGLGVAPIVAIPAALGALVWYLNGLANDWNDVFHWGPNFQRQAAVDLYNLAQKTDDLGITDYGRFTKDEIKSLYEAMRKEGIEWINDEISSACRPLTETNLTEVLKNIITHLNANGVVPTKKQVLGILWGTMVFSKAATATSLPSLLTQGAEKETTTSGVAKTRISVTSTNKPKVFLGTLFSALLKRTDAFERVLDDKITDKNDLLADAQVNLNKWLASLPGRLIYTISIANNPFDENGIKQNGYWVTLQIGYKSISGKFTPLDTILLGPIDPIVYMPKPTEMQQVQYELPGMLKTTEIAKIEFPDGQTKIFDAGGTEISVPVMQPADYSPAPIAPTPTPTPAIKPAETGGKLYAIFRNARTNENLYLGPYASGQAVNQAINQYRDAWNAVDPSNTRFYLTNDGMTDIFPSGYKLAPTPEPLTPTPPTPAPAAPAFPRIITVNVDAVMVRVAPYTNAALAGSQKLFRNDKFTAVDFVIGEKVAGEDRWWKSSYGNYVWSGGTVEKP